MERESGSGFVVVTGGSRGIGFAIAKVLAQSGYSLALWYRRGGKQAEKACAELSALGVEVHGCCVDVSDRGQVRAALADLTTKGPIIGMVNNAGILEQKPFETITDEDWDEVMAVNLKGVFVCSQEAIPLLAKAKGAIVNIASSGGQLGGILAVHYATSKAGVIGLTKSLARVGAPMGVRVNAVSPGLIETDMTKGEIASEAGRVKISQQILMGRAGDVDEVAQAVCFLLSERSSYTTGQVLNVNGGLYMG